jgi:50S ribosomal subunit-associated GTPase HflX
MTNAELRKLVANAGGQLETLERGLATLEKMRNEARRQITELDRRLEAIEQVDAQAAAVDAARAAEFAKAVAALGLDAPAQKNGHLQ